MKKWLILLLIIQHSIPCLALDLQQLKTLKNVSCITISIDETRNGLREGRDILVLDINQSFEAYCSAEHRNPIVEDDSNLPPFVSLNVWSNRKSDSSFIPIQAGGIITWSFPDIDKPIKIKDLVELWKEQMLLMKEVDLQILESLDVLEKIERWPYDGKGLIKVLKRRNALIK